MKVRFRSAEIARLCSAATSGKEPSRAVTAYNESVSLGGCRLFHPSEDVGNAVGGGESGHMSGRISLEGVLPTNATTINHLHHNGRSGRRGDENEESVSPQSAVTSDSCLYIGQVLLKSMIQTARLAGSTCAPRHIDKQGFLGHRLRNGIGCGHLIATG